MREFAKDFYNSKAWKDCRRAYASSVGGLCERCLSRGIYRPGTVVHHKTYLSPENISDPSITLACMYTLYKTWGKYPNEIAHIMQEILGLEKRHYREGEKNEVN